MTVSSPCVGVCILDADGVCIGCYRRVEEIAAWTRMTDFQKAQIIATLAKRRLAVRQARREGLNE